LKKSRLFRMMGVILSLTLLLLVIPVSIVMAATIIDVENIEGTVSTNPYYEEAIGQVGDTVRISGTGTAGTQLHVCFSNQNVALGDDIDDEVTTYEWLADPIVNTLLESYVATADIPAVINDGSDDLDSLYGGMYYFYVTAGSGNNIIAKAEFYITGVSSAEIDIVEGPVGTQVEIIGEGFAPGEEIAIGVWRIAGV
jgi:hypothetical protein